MDFDDLDDAINERLDAGEEVVGHVKENNQPKTGSVLPLMTRSYRLPDKLQMPPKVRQTLSPVNGSAEIERKPVLRLLCLHGAADDVSVDWVHLEDQMPADIEVASYEFPGHGNRKSEPFITDIDTLTADAYESFREAMNTGSFAFLGHSIGGIMAIKIAKRAREELGVDPVCVIMLDRGAAQHPLFTKVGAERYRADPIAFFEYWNPQIYALYKSAGEMGERTMKMWTTEQIMDQDTLEVGFHKFRCPMYAFGAENSFRAEQSLQDMDEKRKALTIKRAEASAYFEAKERGMSFAGHFPEWTYEGWKDWTEHPDGCKVIECRDSDHMTIKRSEKFRTELLKALRSIIDSW